MIEEKIADTEVSLMPEIMNRWSPRGFGSRMVEDEKLVRIFEAARWAPSSRNEQPWRFMIARKGDPHYDKMFAGLNEFNQKWVWTAPVIGVVIAKLKHDYKDRENIYRQHDVGISMGSMLAQVTHEGLSMHIMAGIHKFNILDDFEIDESHYEVLTMFALGYQDESRLKELEETYQESEHKPRSRKELSELVFADGMGSNPEWVK